MPHSANEHERTPHELYHGEKPNFILLCKTGLHVFGCMCYMHIPKPLSGGPRPGGPLTPKAQKGKLHRSADPHLQTREGEVTGDVYPPVGVSPEPLPQQAQDGTPDTQEPRLDQSDTGQPAGPLQEPSSEDAWLRGGMPEFVDSTTIRSRKDVSGQYGLRPKRWQGLPPELQKRQRRPRGESAAVDSTDTMQKDAVEGDPMSEASLREMLPSDPPINGEGEQQAELQDPPLPQQPPSSPTRGEQPMSDEAGGRASDGDNDPEWFMQMILTRFKARFLGKIKSFVGLDVDYDADKGEVALSHAPYIKKMLEKYRMLLAKPVSQPCPQTHRLSKDQSPQTQEERERMNRLPYREGVGSVTYEACALRPDCAFAVKECAMHNNDPGEWHWKALMHLMRYLKDTMDARLVYKRSGTDEIRLTCYSGPRISGTLLKWENPI
ncbi:unnamed protein product [Vitrella brassicaformis CCMP3155]|uniref:Reverse transcriptase Ty1/copia-type domain-containing protein n=1 Tax=Vitrella brassicaformis (strain CCMP3155) TaxID=1169540 RepID=A0A0G4GPJ7_VITBC|nr:unnamed protein product [Vitrella brassicaformis CCMP3155]|eukprot:CEM32108.1 unnamed protein product [Vitrella brassicaformis CCMP3155]